MVDSKEDFKTNIGMLGEDDKSGKTTITVVNIQKFSEESVTKQSDYNVSVQRIYFMDEAHRSYNPKGSFLANLMASDREAVMIALTGTPLIGDGYNTKDILVNTYTNTIITSLLRMVIRCGLFVRRLRLHINQRYRVP